MLKGDGRTYNWTRFNKARSVVTATGATHYTYGGGHSRVKKEVNGVTTYYFGRDYEVTVEKVKGKTVRTMRHHIFAGHELVATHKKILNDDMKQTDTTAYVHRDALGSVDTVTNQVAEIVQQQRYTPFGEIIPEIVKNNQLAAKDIRGYTSHENVGDTGLINMNARLYDPLIGRFVQANTMIPDAGTAQDYNRYAYVRNNPMKYSDPSGHFPFLLGLGLFLFSMTTDDPFLQKVTGLAGNIIMGGALSFGVVGNGAVLSFIGGTAQGGFEEGIKQGIIGGVTAGLTFGLAEEIGHGYKPGPIIGQMVLQGAIAELKGGKFRDGAISALAAKVGSHYGAKYFPTDSSNDKFGRAMVSSMFGGLASEASGGSFEDGATTALFVHLFNDAMAKKKLQKAKAMVTALAKKHNAASIKDKKEYGGYIYEKDGELVNSELFEGKTGHSVGIKFSHKHKNVIAMWHTHGAYSKKSDLSFSAGDILEANKAAKALPTLAHSFLITPKGGMRYYKIGSISPDQLNQWLVDSVVVTKTGYFYNLPTFYKQMDKHTVNLGSYK